MRREEQTFCLKNKVLLGSHLVVPILALKWFGLMEAVINMWRTKGQTVTFFAYL